MRRIVVALFFIIAGLAPAHAERPTQERLFKLFELTGVQVAADTMIDQMRPVIISQIGPAIRRAARSRKLLVPNDFDAILNQEFENAFGDIGLELMVELLPIYQERFTAEEVEHLIGFYDTDLGRRLIAIGQAITPAAMKVGAKVGAQRGQDLVKNVLGRLEPADEAVN